MNLLIKGLGWLSTNKAIISATVGLVEILVKRTSTKVDDRILREIKNLLKHV